MGWIGQINIGGPKIRLNGTAKVCFVYSLSRRRTDMSSQAIHDQILELNPNYEEEFKATYDNKVAARGDVPWGPPPRPINDAVRMINLLTRTGLHC
jgi:hypothetical protein